MENKQIVKRKYPIKRLLRKIIFFVARKFPFIPAEMRAFLHKCAGVKIENSSKTFIGFDVLLKISSATICLNLSRS